MGSSNNTLSNNTCENNNYGILLYSSSNNLIYHNNFINNDNQAYDDGTNTWDDGYPSGGNYWSDYASEDENRGENQDIPGSDGIGDTPYYIPGDSNRDRYPLMEPWSPIIRGVEVSISPSYQSGLPGTTLSYSVTVKNTGDVEDNYDLTVSDNAGWSLELENNLLEIPAGENKMTMLAVKIPGDALPGEEDEITVTATSMADPTVYDSASCIAHAAQVGLTPRAPIYINGNAGFTPENGVNGGGSGTVGDPYIIENWDINAENANGIEIRNTIAHFIVRNCYVHDGKDGINDGNYFDNVINGKIDNVAGYNNWMGIKLSHSDNNIISNCIIEKYWDGIHLNYSSNNIIENCVAKDHVDGIRLKHSNNNLISNNVAGNNIKGIYLSYSDNNLISNNILENNNDGIDLAWYSDNNLISNNILENNNEGISLSDRSNSNDIVGNNLTNISYDGISLGGSFYNNIVGNNVTSLGGTGISVWGSIGNTLSSNNITSGWGISLVFGGETTLTGNIITNSEHGIYLQFTGYNLISNNIVENCTEGIRLRNSTISGNLIYHKQ
ncbi:hypothetical protein ES703_100193 [subsurface metagenome]